LSEGKIYVEPCGRNTAPAILLGTLNILSEEKDAICCVFPADHVIKDEARFNQNLKSAIHLASLGHMVTFGIRPHYPETGYGYIEGGEKVSNGALSIRRFVEKPSLETAEAYVAAGNFFWNSGMFAFKGSVLIEEMETHLPGLVKDMRRMLSKGGEIPLDDYQRLPDISIDHAIMEKTKKGVALPADFGWSDIGTWKSLYDFLPKDENENVISGDVVAQNSRGCLIMGHKRLVVANHLTDMVIVETPDSIFVSDLKNSRDVKSVVEDLKREGRAECRRHVPEYHSQGETNSAFPGGKRKKTNQGKKNENSSS
jgi:mannose-1-phosphate guanylyltransferase